MSDDGALDAPPDEPAVGRPPEAQGEATSHRGQPLVNARRRPGRPPKKKEPPGERTLDEVLASHQTVVTDPEKPPPLPEVFSPMDEVPPVESDPARRDRPSISSRIVLTPDAIPEGEPLPAETASLAVPPVPPPVDSSDGKLRQLEDINARFDLDGSGQFFIVVERVQPRLLNGLGTMGRMRPIKRAISYKEFCEIYGGGQYRLTVYGPPARGGVIDPMTRRLKPKGLTLPIVLTVPWQGEGARDPNPLAALEEEELEERELGMGLGGGDMASALMRRKVNNMADAKMLETSVQRDLQMDERQRVDRKEERAERRAEENAAVRAVKETAEQTTQILRDQLDAANRKLEERESRGSNGAEVVTAMADVMKTFGKGNASDHELTRMRESYEAQLKHERQMYEDRAKDVALRHKNELDDKQRFFERDRDEVNRRAEDSVRQANERMKQLEERLVFERNQERDSAEKERERLRRDNERDLDTVRKDCLRDLDRQKEHYESLLRAEKENNARDRQTLESLHSTKGELQKTVVDAENRRLEMEVKRLSAETARLRDELDKKGNVGKVLKEARDVASAIGYVPDDGGDKEENQSWQQTLLKGVGAAAERLPEILKTAGDLAAMRRGGGAATERPDERRGPPRALPPQGPGYQPVAGPPRMGPVSHVAPLSGWATEDSPPPAFAPLPPPSMEPPRPMPAPPPPPVMQAVPPPAAALEPMYPVTPPGGTPPPMQSARPPRPESMAPPAQPAPALAPPEGPVREVSDEEILQYAPMFEEYLKEEASPEEKARAVAPLIPGIREIARALTGERIAEVLRKNNRGLSPLIRRQGQDYVRRFRQALLRP